MCLTKDIRVRSFPCYTISPHECKGTLDKSSRPARQDIYIYIYIYIYMLCMRIVYVCVYIYIYIYIYILFHIRTGTLRTRTSRLRTTRRMFGRGDDTVGNHHRAQSSNLNSTYQFEFILYRAIRANSISINSILPPPVCARVDEPIPVSIHAPSQPATIHVWVYYASEEATAYVSESRMK